MQCNKETQNIGKNIVLEKCNDKKNGTINVKDFMKIHVDVLIHRDFD